MVDVLPLVNRNAHDTRLFSVLNPFVPIVFLKDHFFNNFFNTYKVILCTAFIFVRYAIKFCKNILFTVSLLRLVSIGRKLQACSEKFF